MAATQTYGQYESDFTPIDPTTGQKKVTAQVQPDKVTYPDPNAKPATPPPAASAGAGAATAGPWGSAGDYKGWIDQRLQQTSNTSDDPNYWKTQAAKDPKFMAGDPSAVAWWSDAIDRAEGSALVKSGQLSLRGASGGAGDRGSASGSISANVGPAFVPAPYTPAPYTPTGTVGQPGQTQTFQNQLLEVLRGRSGQDLNVNPNDPIIKGQVEAFRAEQTRAEREGLSAEAERLGSNVNMRAERRAGAEQIGQATAGFQAQLLGQERDARRQEIQAALNGQMGMLSQQQQLQLQQELAQLDRQQNQYQFMAGNAQQESQFGRTLAENESQFGRNLGQHAYEFDVNDQYRNSPLG